MEFCHIAPTQYVGELDLTDRGGALLLAHLVESDEEYVRSYITDNLNRTTILDNSAYELYREGKPMFEPSKLVDLGNKVQADYIVLPDYPGEHSSVTIAAGLKYATEFKDTGFGTFFVPQSKIGDVEDYINCFAWAASNPLIDYIGVSILGCPNAFGVDDNDYQRFLARPTMFQMLAKRRLLQLAKLNGKKIHFLGMTDGPKEVDVMSPAISEGYIDTWDSSAAVWAGIKGVRFDGTPTGLRNGKVKEAVDFDYPLITTTLDDINYNMKVIDDMVDDACEG